MKFVLFYHSLVSDWNHGNAHFLGDADVVIVHEWNEPELIAAIGSHRERNGDYLLFFHDTHHAHASVSDETHRYNLQHYDGVLVFGEIIRDIYLQKGWASQAWTWHEAADTRVFKPLDAPSDQALDDLVWIGNWGDEERSEEIQKFLIQPVAELELRAKVHGVRYPKAALNGLSKAGIAFGGWLPNYRVPQAFATSKCTLHIPRRLYREFLQGVPTIRVFEALACGIPLICLSWRDTEKLFRPGKDYLEVNTPQQMRDALRLLQCDTKLRQSLAANGLHTVLKKHTCAHRVDELLTIVKHLKGSQSTGRNNSIVMQG